MRICIQCFFVLFLLCFILSPAWCDVISHYADPADGDTVSLAWSSLGPTSTNGGPYTATLYHDGLIKNVWRTFCVEAGNSLEYIDLGVLYDGSQTDLDTAIATGNVVSDAAKWLYYQSWHDPSLLTGYDANNLADNNSLQIAIWLGVSHEGNPIYSTSNSDALAWYNDAVDAVNDGWSEGYLVRVLNPATIGSEHSVPKQSVLYETPEPSTLLLFGCGLIGLASIARRRK